MPRRALRPPPAILALLAGWTLPLHAAAIWTSFVMATIVLPTLIPAAAAVVSRRIGLTTRSYLGALGADLRLALAQSALMIISLAHHTWLMGDAIARTLIRLFVTRRHLLEWGTAAQAKTGPRLDLLGFYRQMAGAVVIAVLAITVAGAGGHANANWPLALPFAALWFASPAIARWTSR